MDLYDEIAARVRPAGLHPWLWQVVAHVSGESPVGCGVSDREDQARAAVEEAMTRYKDRAAFGVLEGPVTYAHCMRNLSGGYTWLPSR